MAEFVWVRRPDRWGEEAVDLHECRKFTLAMPCEENDGDLVEYFLMQDGRWIGHSYQWNGLSDSDSGFEEVYEFESLPRVCEGFLFVRGAVPPDLVELQEVVSFGRRLFGQYECSGPREFNELMYIGALSSVPRGDCSRLIPYPNPYSDCVYWTKWYPHMAESGQTDGLLTEGTDVPGCLELKPKLDRECDVKLGDIVLYRFRRINAKNHQLHIIKCLHEAGWPDTSIPVGLDETAMMDAIKAFNRNQRDRSVQLVLERDHSRVGWTIRQRPSDLR